MDLSLEKVFFVSSCEETSFWPPSRVYISVIITHITNYNLSHKLRRQSCFSLPPIANWLVCPKELRRHGYIWYNIYNWYESGLFDYWQYCSPPIWKCILQAGAKYKHRYKFTLDDCITNGILNIGPCPKYQTRDSGHYCLSW